MPGCQGRRVARSPLRLHADDPDLRSQGLHRHCDSGKEPAASRADQHRADVGDLLDDLKAEGALTGHDVDVIERVDQHRTGLFAECARRDERLVDGAACEHDLGAVVAGGLHLGDRGPLRHEDRGAHAESPRSQRHALRMIARARRDDSAQPLLVVELRDAVVGAADLERSRALEVLGDEVDGAADRLEQPARARRRQVADDALEPIARRLDVREHDGAGHAGHPSTAVLPGSARCAESRACDAA